MCNQLRAPNEQVNQSDLRNELVEAWEPTTFVRSEELHSCSNVTSWKGDCHDAADKQRKMKEEMALSLLYAVEGFS